MSIFGDSPSVPAHAVGEGWQGTQGCTPGTGEWTVVAPPTWLPASPAQALALPPHRARLGWLSPVPSGAVLGAGPVQVAWVQLLLRGAGRDHAVLGSSAAATDVIANHGMFAATPEAAHM